jgi:uncharacterized protein (UPF0276 family)
MSPSNLNDKYSYQKITDKAGFGLRGNHFDSFLSSQFNPPWVEVHVENFLGGGKTKQLLSEIRAKSEVALHGVNLNLASTDKLDLEYLKKVKELIDFVDPVIFSEHLAWTGVNGKFLQDLLPFPYNDESLENLIKKINYAQDYLGIRIFVENPATYLQYRNSTYKESDFIKEVVKQTNCGLLLDICNLYIASKNHQFNPLDYLKNLEDTLIGQYHISGYDFKTYQEHQIILIDAHNKAPQEEIWQLFQNALGIFGPKPTLVEWDQNLPTYEVLLSEVGKAQNLLDRLKVHRRESAEASNG